MIFVDCFLGACATIIVISMTLLAKYAVPFSDEDAEDQNSYMICLQQHLKRRNEVDPDFLSAKPILLINPQRSKTEVFYHRLR